MNFQAIILINIGLTIYVQYQQFKKIKKQDFKSSKSNTLNH